VTTKQWFVYIITNPARVLYTGITTDLSMRLAAHNRGVGAKFTKGKGPWTMVASLQVANRSVASQVEIRIKKQPSDKKVAELERLRSFLKSGS